jgi:hypothetical protein
LHRQIDHQLQDGDPPELLQRVRIKLRTKHYSLRNEKNRLSTGFVPVFIFDRKMVTSLDWATYPI